MNTDLKKPIDYQERLDNQIEELNKDFTSLSYNRPGSKEHLEVREILNRFEDKDEVINTFNDFNKDMGGKEAYEKTTQKFGLDTLAFSGDEKSNDVDKVVLYPGSYSAQYKERNPNSILTDKELKSIDADAGLVSAFDSSKPYKKEFDSLIVTAEADKVKSIMASGVKEVDNNNQTEIAQPGRTYTGVVIDVNEDTTIQKTPNGKFIIHETENLPGIKNSDESGNLQIRYDSGHKGDIIHKSNDLEIEKEKEAKKEQEFEFDN